MAEFDAWNVFVWTFEDFEKSMLKFEIVIVVIFVHMDHIGSMNGPHELGGWAVP